MRYLAILLLLCISCAPSKPPIEKEEPALIIEMPEPEKVEEPENKDNLQEKDPKDFALVRHSPAQVENTYVIGG